MNSRTITKSKCKQISDDSNQQLRAILLASLSKLHSKSTAQKGFIELRSLIAQLSQNQLVILLNLLDSNDLSKQGKKDYIKIFGILAQIRANEIQDQLSRIVQIINKRIQEEDISYLQIIQDTFVNINGFIIQNSPNKTNLFFQITESLQSNFMHNNKIAQQISAASLCKIIKSSQSQLLELVCKQYTQKTLDILKSPHCLTQQGLLESLLCLILIVEEIFESNLEDCLNTICNCLKSTEWYSRKIAIDILYTSSVIFPHFFRANQQYSNKISELRFDKIKHVRDAASTAITSLKESQMLQQLSQKEHKSLFKSNANRNFFERTSDIQIIENKPRENEQEYQQKRESYQTIDNKIQYSNEKKQSANLTESNEFASVHLEKLQYLQEPFQIKTFEFSTKKEQVNLNQQFQASNINSSTPNKQSTDLLTLCDSVKVKQLDQYEQLLTNKIEESEQATFLEFSKINQRIDKIELLLVKINIAINKDINNQQQQTLIQQKKDQFLSNSLNVINQEQQQNQKMKELTFFVEKNEQITESKLKGSEFEHNSYQMNETEYKDREKYQRSISENSPKRIYEQSIIRNHSKQISEQNCPQIQLKQDSKINQQQKIMSKIEEQLKKDNINEAYSTALTTLDDQIIITTMMKTGPCTERLDSTQVEFLLHKLRTLDWIENVLQHHLTRMPSILLQSIQTELNNTKTPEQVKQIKDLIEIKKTLTSK